jgi:hypothetical protein
MIDNKQRAGLSEVFKLYKFASTVPTYAEVIRDHDADDSRDTELLETAFAKKFDALEQRVSLLKCNCQKLTVELCNRLIETVHIIH